MASASMADEPVYAAPPLLAIAIAKFAPNAYSTDFIESALPDMPASPSRGAVRRGLLFEQVFDAVGPALGVGRVALAASLQRLVELLHQLALVFGQAHRCLHGHVAVEVARITRAHAFDALAAQAERLAVLCAFRQLDLRLAGQRGHGDVAAERGERQRYRHGAVQIVAVALKDLVLLDTDLDVQV